MPRKSPELDPSQGSLFVHNEHTKTEYPSRDAVASPVSADIEFTDGPSVNILERNAHLQNVLGRFGVMSRTSGLRIAAGTGLRRELEDRYPNVDRVVGSAAARSDRKHLESKQEFAKAFGLSAMIDSGLVNPDEAKAIARKSYAEELIPVFADAKGRKRRDDMKGWLNYQERTLKGERTRKPTTSLPKPPNAV